MLRDFALTIPAVTVEVRSNGFPTAKTHCPTLTLSEFPNFIKGRLSASTFTRAMSVVGSVPTTLATYSLLSLSVTTIFSAFATTWLLVAIYPSADMITPEPEAPCGLLLFL